MAGEIEVGPKGFATLQALAEAGKPLALTAGDQQVGRYMVSAWRVEHEPIGRYYVTLVPVP